MLSFVVDDHDMAITHVIRGDDHLTNTFRQIQIYKACGWQSPKFAHIPLIYGPDGAKLSKRHGAVSADEYRELGYLPEAILNYLLRLGWSHGDDEIISREQAIKWFEFDSVGRAPARFDISKLNHLNAYYMRSKDEQLLLECLLPFIERFTPNKDFNKNMLAKGLKSLKERSETVLDLAKSAMIYIEAPTSYDEACSKFSTKLHIDLLRKFISNIENLDEFIENELLNIAKCVAAENGIKLVEIAQSLRAALTGSTVSPSVFEIMAILGKEESMLRINRFIEQHNR
jgi:glutamyl-tRNA synthetase